MDNFEIILVTYNREKFLKKTLKQLFAENSPIKNFSFTILNNKSTDGTEKLIKEYQKRFSNIKLITHNRNIGGNANICRAFELATAKYVWVLCDDDEFDFSNWEEAEKAMLADYDMIVVSNYLFPKKNIVNLIKQLTFVPAAIYKTSIITDTVMINAEYNIHNLFPQTAISAKFINDDKSIYVLDKSIVTMKENPDCSYTRGCDKDVHPYATESFWGSSWIRTIPLFKDLKIRNLLIEETVPLKEPFGLKGSFDFYIETNDAYGGNLRNLVDYYDILNDNQKTVFFYSVLDFYARRSDINKINSFLQAKSISDILLPNPTKHKTLHKLKRYLVNLPCSFLPHVFWILYRRAKGYFMMQKKNFHFKKFVKFMVLGHL